ncbi:MAG: anti-sigma factor family protein [Eubacteriales bacterium]|jgi:hypothetical protein
MQTPCAKWREIIHMELDGFASPVQQNLLREHLEQCPACRTYYEEMRQVRDALGQWEQPPLENSEEFVRQVMSRVKQTEVTPISAGRHRRRWVAWAASAAAVCLVFVYASKLPQESQPVVENPSTVQTTPDSSVGSSQQRGVQEGSDSPDGQVQAEPPVNNMPETEVPESSQQPAEQTKGNPPVVKNPPPATVQKPPVKETPKPTQQSGTPAVYNGEEEDTSQEQEEKDSVQKQNEVLQQELIQQWKEKLQEVKELLEELQQQLTESQTVVQPSEEPSEDLPQENQENPPENNGQEVLESSQ